MPKITSIIREDAAVLAADLATVAKPLAGSTLLLTGAAGFLGSTLLDALAALNRGVLSEKCRVLALDNYATALPERVAHLGEADGITFVKHDVVKPYDPPSTIDYIIHAASIASPIVYRKYPLATIDANVGGTRNMLELARTQPLRSMIFMSTSEVYGDPDPAAVPIVEDYRGRVSCTGPRACYDESKRLGETLCVTFQQQFGTPVKMVRPFNVYGPGQRLDDERIMPDMMSGALARRPLVLLSDGRATRAFCYVRDFLGGLVHVMMSDGDGEPFNVGNDEEISIGDLARKVAVLEEPALEVKLEKSPDAHYLTDNPQRRCPNIGKVKAKTGWSPKVPLAEGLARTFRSYREEQPRA